MYLSSRSLAVMLAAGSDLDPRRTLELNQLMSPDQWGVQLLFEQRAISRDKPERCTFLFASAFPLSCLILDQRLWPDCVLDDVENKHRGHIDFPRGVKERRPLENAAMLQTEDYGVARKRFGNPPNTKFIRTADNLRLAE
jgi:hypothetical protein